MSEERQPQREHVLSRDCWCNPRVESVPAKKIARAKAARELGAALRVGKPTSFRKALR